jgi:uncharacterized protein (DUF849 family)
MIPHTAGDEERGSSHAAELIVECSLTGDVASKAMTPHVPVTPAEIVEDACRVLELGAAIVRVDARDRHGLPTLRPEIFETIILGIRAHHPDAIICVGGGGPPLPALDARTEVLDLRGRARPDLASLPLGTLDAAGPGASQGDLVLRLAARMVERGIKPALDCYDWSGLQAAELLVRRGLAQAPVFCTLLLGGQMPPGVAARHLANLLVDLPGDALWSVGGMGANQLPMNLLALALGGHCRVGVGDNIHLDRERRELATNAALVTRIRDLSERYGRPLASRGAARKLLGLPAPRPAPRHSPVPLVTP